MNFGHGTAWQDYGNWTGALSAQTSATAHFDREQFFFGQMANFRLYYK
jgi:hypothetical protein